MTASDAIRTLIAPLLTDWHVQFGRWVDAGATARHAVIKPAGGGKAELIRTPQLTLSLIGAVGDQSQTIQAAADSIIEAMRTGSAGIVFLQPGEPVFMPTDDGRPIFEIAVSAITT